MRTLRTGAAGACRRALLRFPKRSAQAVTLRPPCAGTHDGGKAGAGGSGGGDDDSDEDGDAEEVEDEEEGAADPNFSDTIKCVRGWWPACMRKRVRAHPT